MNATPKVTFALLSLAAALSSAPLSAQDKFADIATARYQLRSTLVEPAPPELPQKFLPVENDPQAAFRPMHTLSTGAELKAELAKLREQYAPYMKDVAPALPVSRASVPLDVFDWRIGTEADAGDFAAVERGEGEWTAVKIPHYGAPLGRAVTYYRKVVDLSPAMFRAGALFICFKGVDYKAEVYVNGTLAGTHTGFFAPFEFNIAKLARPGKNTILVKVSNDYTTTGNSLGGENVRGDKIYAATGPGYDEPVQGWHHCPAGMGIYQTCRIEARNPMHVNDLFVRPLPEENRAEAWVEINNFNETQENVKLVVSVYGQNFEQTILKEMEYIPSSTFIPGVGDLAKPTDNQAVRLKMGHGVNYLRIPLDMTGFRWWNPDTPWLYQLQVTVQDEQGNELDAARQQFGMRSFTMDTVSVPRGRMYLNGEQIRLRGANTMGHLQPCVIRGDTAQLIDDILLAKLCNMNYLRLTQRPVQPEIYEWFDKLGLLNQTDLPLFGSLRRNLFSEAVKQAEEMERLVRKHPSTIMVSYINERFPNAEGQPQRSFGELAEYERLFTALDQAVLITNPDRVIKAGDGDYDPPSPGLPDSHCYNGWYNGHGLGLGKMHRGYWQSVKPGWLYACGEFGSEGLDPEEVMYKYYPKGWLPVKGDEKSWTANLIPQAQTHRFHYMWYNTQDNLHDWVRASWDHQEWVTKFTTEAFRRDGRMVSFAIHLFIDAFPSGWMKTIMDVDRGPKPAYFAYRNALAPLMTSLRTDRWTFFPGERVNVEAWVCNDRNDAPQDYTLHYQLEKEGRVVWAHSVRADIPRNDSRFQGFIDFEAPKVGKRTAYQLRISLNDAAGNPVHQNVETIEVFPALKKSAAKVCAVGDKAAELAAAAGAVTVPSLSGAQVMLCDDIAAYNKDKEAIDAWVAAGGKLVLLELPAGDYRIGAGDVKVERTTMGEYYFASPEVPHPLMKAFKPMDFKMWYDPAAGYVHPLLGHTVSAPGWTPLLLSGNSSWVEDRGPVMAACELRHGKGLFRISEVKLAGRTVNPVAGYFADILINR